MKNIKQLVKDKNEDYFRPDLNNSAIYIYTYTTVWEKLIFTFSI